MSTDTRLATELFDHPALLYHGDDEYLAGTVPFVQAGLDLGQPVLVAVPAANLAMLRDGMGDAAARVHWRDMRVAGVNPGRIIPGVLLAFAAAHPGLRVRIIGEPIWAGRTELEYPACAQHEALINTAFAGRDAAILCPYDIGRLDQRAIDDAFRTHPVVETATDRWSSTAYGDPVAVADTFNQPLPDPPSTVVTLTYDIHGIADARALVASHGTGVGLPSDRVAELVLAVNELTTNSVEHGGGAGTLAVWRENGYLACEVRDAGYIANPLAGRVFPQLTEPEGGHGLVMVHQLCDLVRIHTRPGATTIRVYMALR
jgi:anti-sigma regulatory factor (Ser/Thr protein kinase)